MTTHTTAQHATTGTPHHTALRATGLLGLVGGAAWIIDTVTIAVINRPFDPLDSVLFFAGLACLLGTVLALAVHLSAGRTGAARVAVAVGAFLATGAVLGALSFSADFLARHIFSPANIGLHDEWSCFTIGLCLLVIAAWAGHKARSPKAVGATSSRRFDAAI